jgi:hypothetical protein
MKKMKKFSWVAFLTGYMLAGYIIPVMAQKVDTTFYDKEWHGVKFKELASYIRYDFNFNDPGYDNKARIFFLGGQLESEGTPISNDKHDGTLAKWKHELTRYYPNGVKRLVCNFDNNGNLHGKMFVWDEKGALISEQNYELGLLQGPSLVYDADNPDILYRTQFEKGQPVNNEMLICYHSGKTIKVDYTTKKIITIPPGLDDCKSYFKDGIESWYYDMNGIYVSLHFTRSKLYGNYFQCFIQFVNNTNDPIEINPSKITGQHIKKDKVTDIELMPAEDLLKKIARTQAWSEALSGFASSMNNRNAGYSSSTSSGLAVGNGGYVSGSSTTTTYNAAEKRAVMNEEQQRLNNQAKSNKEFKDAVDGSVLKRTVVEPGEELIKSFYIKYQSSDKLIVNLEIEGIIYPFEMKKL